MALRIMTDSSCDLPSSVINALNITVVPCNIHFGQQAYRDGVDMQPAEFYRRLAGDVHPTTSQPSVESFLEGYRKLQGQADEVLAIHLSSKLSTTFTAAKMAREQLHTGPRVEVIDSNQVSLGLGLLVLEAARQAQAGVGLKDIAAMVEREKGKVAAYVAVDTLEYLVKGGRASKLQGFFGSLLSIKPIIGVKEDGEVHPIDRVRNRRKAIDRLIELAQAAKPLKSLGVLYSTTPEDAETLAASCTTLMPKEKIVLSQFSAVLGTHVGPRALGLVVWPGTP